MTSVVPRQQQPEHVPVAPEQHGRGTSAGHRPRRLDRGTSATLRDNVCATCDGALPALEQLEPLAECERPRPFRKGGRHVSEIDYLAELIGIDVQTKQQRAAIDVAIEVLRERDPRQLRQIERQSAQRVQPVYDVEEVQALRAEIRTLRQANELLKRELALSTAAHAKRVEELQAELVRQHELEAKLRLKAAQARSPRSVERLREQLSTCRKLLDELRLTEAELSRLRKEVLLLLAPYEGAKIVFPATGGESLLFEGLRAAIEAFFRYSLRKTVYGMQQLRFEIAERTEDGP